MTAHVNEYNPNSRHSINGVRVDAGANDINSVNKLILLKTDLHSPATNRSDLINKLAPLA